MTCRRCHLSSPFQSPDSRPVAHHRPALDDMQTLLAMVLSHGVAVDRLQDLRAEIAAAALTPAAASAHPTPTTATEEQAQIVLEQSRRPSREWVQRQSRQASANAATPRSAAKPSPSPRHAPAKKRPAAAQPAQAQKRSQRPRRQVGPPVVQSKRRGGAANRAEQKPMRPGPATTPKPPKPISARKEHGQSTSKPKRCRRDNKGQKRKVVGGRVEERTEVYMSSAGLYKESKGGRLTINNNPFLGFHRVRVSGEGDAQEREGQRTRRRDRRGGRTGGGRADLRICRRRRKGRDSWRQKARGRHSYGAECDL